MKLYSFAKYSLLGLVFFAPVARAQEIKLSNPLGCDDFECVVTKIIDAIFALSIPVVAAMVIIGGFQILAGGSSPEKVKSGRQTILWAVVGFVVILFAKSVVFIIQDVFGAE